MERLLECVPNFSDGHHTMALDAIATALSAHQGAQLIDRTSDRDHERSVFTVAGAPDAVRAAMGDAVKVAIDRIDMRSQRGQHPRIGAIDVIPFTPLGSATMTQTVADAREFAADIAERYDLPVFLYAAAARRDDRKVLAEVRRPGYEGLADAMLLPHGAPDFGPRRPHPSAGAVAVGARPFLIAYNIQLGCADVTVARRMAHRLRERDGGLPAVQALGLELVSRGYTQLSMNIIDHQRTPLWRVWEEAQALAKAEGIAVLESELIGLAPMAALLEVADHIGVPSAGRVEDRLLQVGAWLKIREFDPSMALELRLASQRLL